MAKTSWFVGGVKKKTKKSKISEWTANTCVFDVELMLQNAGPSFGGTDPEEERDAPPEATPVTFPIFQQTDGHAWTQDDPPPKFQSLFSRILKPSDISEQHVKALNIRVLPICSVNELVPDAPDGASYLEPATPTPTSVSALPERPTYGEDQTARKRKDFDEKLAELRIENDLAFRTLSKTVATGVRPPRIAHMRKFYVGLESMSQYWDCSLDRYYDVNEAGRGENGEQAVKRQKLENGFSPKGSPQEQSTPTLEHALQIMWNNASKGSAESTKLPVLALSTRPKEGQDTTDEYPPLPVSPISAPPEPQTRKRYKGRRTSTGREMPDQFRTDTVKAFVEGTIWAFHANLSSPRSALQFDKLNLPVRQTGTVYRIPNSRGRFSNGWREGPILRVQVRAETEFQDEAGEQHEHMARLDSLREIAALLQLAQERRREGREEVKPGEGKWWTTKPRWGGGPGGEAQNEIGNTDILQVAEEVLDASRSKESKKVPELIHGRDQRRSKTPAILWKELKVGSGNWTPKIDYIAIGKDPSWEWDEVRLYDSPDVPILMLSRCS
jgi:hypothetical protein